MQKYILINLLLLSAIFADNLQIAKDSCPIYNNMKHTKNSGNQTLQIGLSYRVIDEKKEQYYISVPDINTPNRWVDKSCFGLSQKITQDKVVIKEKSIKIVEKKESKNISSSSDMLLALSWQNAFCETHRYLKECKNRAKKYTDINFGLHGLWPQPRENIYCDVSSEDKSLDKSHKWNRLSSLKLSDKTRKELLEVMPSSASSYLQRHEWLKHGTCANMNEDDYYSKAIALTKEFNGAKVGDFFRQNIGKKVTLAQIGFKMNESFGRGAGNKIELICQKGLISEIWLHLGSEGDDMQSLLKSGQNVRSRCKEGIIDRVGF